MGIGSRSEVKKFLKTCRVKLNEKFEKNPNTQVDIEKDEIYFDDEIVIYKEFTYLMLNKPKDYISATFDTKLLTLLDLLEFPYSNMELFPVGRLDIDTHGLLLLTNNGALAHAMLSPKKHVAKVYRAKVDGIMTEKDRTRFEAGIKLKDFTCKPAQLTILETNEEQGTSLVEITISEGKFHQVKRMVAACGKKVADLERLAMGPLTLDKELATGTFRRLTQEEIKSLKRFGVEPL